jgi:predicted transcriptional regulator
MSNNQLSQKLKLLGLATSMVLYYLQQSQSKSAHKEFGETIESTIFETYVD